MCTTRDALAGGLPTFLDISRLVLERGRGVCVHVAVSRAFSVFISSHPPPSNFDASVVEEDTWVRQLHANRKRLLFMGDDTWQSMFPEQYFSRAFFYPSFDVKVRGLKRNDSM